MQQAKEVSVEDHQFSAFPAAARGGPGLVAVFRKQKVDRIPSGLDPGIEREWIERRAKLFEAGAYPDKGVTVTSSQLEALARGFIQPVPILIEHSDSALELGFLTRVEAMDGELFGTVALTREANDLVESSGAKSLSLGLSPDLTEIREVSIVRTPRVADARLFSGICFCGELCGAGASSKSDLSDPSDTSDSSDGSVGLAGFREEPQSEGPWRQRYEALCAGNRRIEAEQAVQGFVKEGRICPAQAPFAEAMLQAEDTIEFDGESRPIRQLLIAMIERQPPMSLFSAIVPDHDRDGHATSALFLPEEAAFYRRHFPDVSLEEIAARKGRVGS